MTKCKICGDPIKRCPRKGTNNWCHTWHHEHVPRPSSSNIFYILIIILLFSFLLIIISNGNNIQNFITKDIKIPGIPKSEPCIQQTSPDGRMTISQGDCSKSQIYGLSPDEQKLVGTWKIDTNIMKGSFTFNSDKTGTFSSQLYGNVYFHWKASGGMIYTDASILNFNPINGGINYKLVNNDKTLDIGEIYFDKSWW